MIDCIYDQAWPFYNGIAKVGFADRFSRLSYIYINKNGSALTQATYQSAQSFYNSSAVVRINWKEGFINDRGELFISAIYEFANPFSEDIAAVELAKNNWAFINNKGNIISQLEHGINIFKRYRYDEFNRWNLSCFSESVLGNYNKLIFNTLPKSMDFCKRLALRIDDFIKPKSSLRKCQ